MVSLADEQRLGDPQTPELRLPVFSGPLDLLLYLVDRDEIDILNIQVADVLEQYLAHLRILKDVDVNAAGEFLVMAARLMELKSRMLLPAPEEEEEEEGEGDDPRLELVRQLLEYRKVKEAALGLEELREQHARRFGRLYRLKFEDVPDEPEEEETDAKSLGLEDVGLYDLFAFFDGVMRQTLSNQPVELVYDDVSIEERIDEILERLRHDPRTSFSGLVGEQPERRDVVGVFIALLELTRRKLIHILQPSDQADIHVHARSEETDGVTIWDGEAADAQEAHTEVSSLPQEGEAGAPKDVSVQPDKEAGAETDSAVEGQADGTGQEQDGKAAGSHKPRRQAAPRFEGVQQDDMAGFSEEEARLLHRVEEVVDRADAVSRLFELSKGGTVRDEDAEEAAELRQLVRAAARDAQPRALWLVRRVRQASPVSPFNKHLHISPLQAARRRKRWRRRPMRGR